MTIMKKLSKIVLSLLLILLLIPGQSIKADEPVENGVTGISLDANGVLTWNDYPNAQLYFVDLFNSATGDMPYFVTTDPKVDLQNGLDNYIDDYGNRQQFPAGYYMIQISAVRASDVQDNPDFTSYTTLAYTIYDQQFVYGDPQSSAYKRIYGNNRYTTSRAIADEVLDAFRNYASDTVVITTGANYPDALSGSFLALNYHAPVLMISAGSSADVVAYVKQNIRSGGTVYVLGGTKAVPDEWLGDLSNTYNVKRLSGKTRYDTNVEILKEGSSFLGYYPLFLVCTGKKYADSLSCSSMPIPILLVGDSLTDSQREFLSTFDKNTVSFVVIGGTGAVSTAVEEDLNNYGTVNERISGKDRYETSALIAQEAFTYVGGATLATGKQFPDGLSGGPLAYSAHGPLLLVDEGHTSYAEAYVASHPGLIDKYVLGGTGAVSEEVAERVFGQSAASLQ